MKRTIIKSRRVVVRYPHESRQPKRVPIIYGCCRENGRRVKMGCIKDLKDDKNNKGKGTTPSKPRPGTTTTTDPHPILET